MASLRELQRSFAAALRDPATACAVVPAANLAVYRNSASTIFRVALERTYPVVLKRVGADYFRQLVHEYRACFPSRSGDLHWAGRDFPVFLAAHLRNSEYAWLADLAGLEWLRAEVSVAREAPAIRADALAGFAADELEWLVFTLQPSLRLVASAFPIFTVWQNNQAEYAPPVEQSVGSEQGMVRIRDESVEIRLLEPRLFSYLSAFSRGSTLGEAMTIAGLEEAGLHDAMGFVFREGLVSSMALNEAARDGNGRRMGTSS